MWVTVCQKPVASRLGVVAGMLISLYCCLVTANWIGFGILLSPIMCCLLIALRLIMHAMERLVRKCAVGARPRLEKKIRRRKRQRAAPPGVAWRKCLLSTARILLSTLNAWLGILDAMHHGDVVLVEVLVWIRLRRCIQRTRCCLWMCTWALQFLSQLLSLRMYSLCRYCLRYTMEAPHAAPLVLIYQATWALRDMCIVMTFVEEIVRLQLCFSRVLKCSDACDFTDSGNTGFVITLGPGVGIEKHKGEAQNLGCDRIGAMSSESAPHEPGPILHENHDRHSGKLHMFTSSGRSVSFNAVLL